VKDTKQQIQELIQQKSYSKALEKLDSLDENTSWKNGLTLRCLRIAKRNKEAIELATNLLSSGTDEAETLHAIALVLNEHGQSADAIKIYEGLISKDKDNLDYLKTYASILSNSTTLDKAEEILRHILSINPSDATTYAQLGRILCRTGRVELGLSNYQRASMLEPKNVNYLQRLVYWSNYSDKTTSQSSAQLARLWAKRAFPKSTKGSDSWRFANPNKPLKIGIISSDFCKHAVSFFITPLLKHINREHFTVVAYSNVKKPDEVTENIKQYCDIWNDVSSMNDTLLAAQIGADQLDVLVDLNGHTANNKLSVFSQQIVPIQISWLGYPGTTGLDSIHYRFTDSIADPDIEQDKFYSEKLIRLPKSFLCYEPHATAPDIKIRTKGQKIRFGSFNNLAKISKTTLDAWASVLREIPESTLYIKRQQLINESAKSHLINEFSERGISKDRLILKTSKAKIEKHLDEYNEIDIALDTSPYNGTTTTLESLWMGTPVLTLTGKTHASRVSASILTAIGHEELIAVSIDEFSEKAVQLNKHNDLVKFSESIRETMSKSSLLNHQEFADDFGLAIRQKWQRSLMVNNKLSVAAMFNINKFSGNSIRRLLLKSVRSLRTNKFDEAVTY